MGGPECESRARFHIHPAETPAINALSSDELGKDSEVADEDQGTENEENEPGNL